MAQVTFGDISTGEATSATFDVAHTIASGEGLIVGVLLEVVDAAKEVQGITWGISNTALTKYNAFSPSHGKLRLEVWYLTNPSAETEWVTVSMEGGNSQKMGVVAISAQNHDLTTMLYNWVTEAGSFTSADVDGLDQEAADDLSVCFAAHLQSPDAFTMTLGDTEHADLACQGAFRMWAASDDPGDGFAVISWEQAQSKEYSHVGFVIKAAAGGPVERRPKPSISMQAVHRASTW